MDTVSSISGGTDERTYQRLAHGDAEYASSGADAHQIIQPSPPESPEIERASIGFAKSALVLRDRLDDIRRKHQAGGQSIRTTESKSAEPAAATPDASSALLDRSAVAATIQSTRKDRAVQFLRIIQSALTAVVSLTIAVLQGISYVNYKKTEGSSGTSLSKVDLLPTLLLFGVATAALTFDAAGLLIVFMPKRQRVVAVAAAVANKAHYVVVAIKSVSYVLTMVVCMNKSGATTNLWTLCSGQDTSMCKSQRASTALGFLNIAIEVVGVLLQLLMSWPPEVLSADASGSGFDLEKDRGDIGTVLADLTPQQGQAGSTK